MFEKDVLNRVGHFLLDRLLLCILLVMMLTIIGMLFLLPQRGSFYQIPDRSFDWPSGEGQLP